MKLKLCLFSILILLFSAMTVSAGDIKATVNDEFNTVKISTYYEAGTTALLKITGPGYTENDIQANYSALFAADQLTVDENGRILLSYALKADMPEGRYIVYLDFENGIQYKGEFWYLSETTRNQDIQSIRMAASADDIETELFTKSAVYADGIEYSNNDKYNLCVTNEDKVSHLLFGIKNEITDIKSFKNAVKRCNLVYDMSISNINDYIDENHRFKENLWADNNGMKDVAKLFMEGLSDDGREAVLNGLMGNDYATISEFESEFASLCIINGIYKYSLNGFGHITNVLALAQNKNIINVPVYNSLVDTKKNSVNDKLLRLTGVNIGNLGSEVERLSNAEKAPLNQNNGGNNQGGVSAGGGNFAAVTFESSEKLEEVKRFIDIGSYSWAENAIESLADRGIINGVSQNEFMPQKSVTREEFIKMIVLVLKLDISDTKTSFKDVDESAWYAPYVAAAEKAGITKGRDDSSFGTGESVSREDCCVMLARAFEMSGQTDELSFNDNTDVSDYAKESIGILTSKGFILGDDKNCFNPKKACSRAEAAVILYRLIGQY